MQTQTKIFIMLCKINRIHFFLQSLYVLILYLAPLTKIKILFLLSTCTEELMSTQKIITFLPNPIPGNGKLPCLSNPISQPEYLYLSISAFFAKETAPNKIFSAYRKIITYLIKNVIVYYFPIIKCNFILFQTASIEFYSCFSPKKA